MTRKDIEHELDQEYCEALKITMAHGVLRFVTQHWVIEKMIDDRIVQNVHLEALRRISASMGHPLRDVPDKSCLDLADLAVGVIQGAKRADV